MTQDKMPTWWTPPWPSTLDDPDASWRAPSDGNSESAVGWHVGDADVTLDDDSILAPLEAELAQVRSRDRVRDLAEVFTHQREVDAILDSVSDAFTALDVKFLEPACGSGNFCVEILRHKLRLVTTGDCVSQEQYEHRLLRAIASSYGVDISPDNVAEARGRMAHVLLGHYQADANTVEPTTGFLNAAAVILGDNIVSGDTLNDVHRIELCEWRPASGARFQRVWSFALVPPGERGLFWAERIQDPEPVHYAELRIDPRPAKSAKKPTTGVRR